jgi:enediyne biosynthesis protein E4
VPFPTLDLGIGSLSVLRSNERGGTFRDAAREAGVVFQRPEMSCGIAFVDLDNDGRFDFVYLNQTPAVGHRLQFEGVRSARDGAGAYVTVKRGDGLTRRRRVDTDGSYLSASDICVHFGVGHASAGVEVTVEWLGGGL